MDLRAFLAFTQRSGASDLHISAGAPPMVRVQGTMRQFAVPGLPEREPMPAALVERMVFSVLSEEQQKRLETDHELDFALTLGEVGRFRGNVLYQNRGLACVFRVIPDRIQTLEELGLPPTLQQLAQRENGLVLVTGPTGSGKSTTLAAMVDWVNRNRAGHIITIEDPIEFVHQSQSCLVNQREVGSQTWSFANALRACLREDPDVILVGEMRDRETIALAIAAAETGHLVFGTLHTSSAPKTIDRILNVFPAGEKEQIRATLAESLQGVVAQLLLPTLRGGRVAAHEILIGTSAVRAMIREGKTHTLVNAIQTGQRHGMQSLEQSLTRLSMQGVISQAVVNKALGASEAAPSASAGQTPDQSRGQSRGQSAAAAAAAAARLRQGSSRSNPAAPKPSRPVPSPGSRRPGSRYVY